MWERVIGAPAPCVKALTPRLALSREGPGGTRPAESTCAQRWLQGMLGPQRHRLGAQGRQMGAFHLAFLGFMLPLSYPPAPHSTAQVTF